MRSILAFIRRDLGHLSRNAVAAVVVVGIIAVPALYAWFNIAGSWDPYGSTRDLSVAVANLDAGYESDLVPVRLNLGERVVDELRASDTIGYTVVSRDEALEGVESGAYYAAVIIPEDFSERMLSALSDDPRQAHVDFYQNEKANAIAEIVTDKASSAVQRDIDTSFARAATEVGAGALVELGGALDDGQLERAAERLEDAAADAAVRLGQAAARARSLSALSSSLATLLGSDGNGIERALDPILDGGDAVRSAADGLGSAGEAVDGATDSISGALSAGAEHLDDVDKAIDDAFDAAGDQADRLQEGLGQAQAAADDQAEALSSLSQSLSDADAKAAALEESLPEGSPARTRIHSARAALQGLSEQVDGISSELEELSGQLGQTSQDLQSGTRDAADARAQLHTLVEGARSDLTDAKDSYDADVRGSLQDLSGDLSQVAGDIDASLAGLAATLDDAKSAAKAASGGLEGMAEDVSASADTLEKTAGELDDLAVRLRDALASSNMDEVRAILSSGPTALGAFVSDPVEMVRTPIYPVENNGSAMAPFYTTLAIWIGGVVLAALVRVPASEVALEETGCSQSQAYIGRLALFVAMGLAQATLICAGDLLVLGVQCEHPLLMFAACWAASFAFVNVIFSLTASFGDVGKAVAVVLMVIQVAGAGGTFPEQMLPQAFQTIFPWLPFVHSENALRGAMFGLYGDDYLANLAVLGAFAATALVLGLALRRPLAHLNERIEHALEATGVM